MLIILSVSRCVCVFFITMAFATQGTSMMDGQYNSLLICMQIADRRAVRADWRAVCL